MEEKISQLNNQIDNLYIQNKSEGSLLLQIEGLKDDNIRLIQMLKSMKKSEDIESLNNNNINIKNIKIYKKNNNKNNKNDLLLNEAYSYGLKLKQKVGLDISNTILKNFVAGINLIWQDKYEKDIKKIKKNYQKELDCFHSQSKNLNQSQTQKITNIKYKKDKKNERVSYFLSFIKNNEIIGYQKNKIFSFNMKDYSKTCEIETNDNIIRLNLMKDNETIFAVFEKSIKKLKFENNQIILENYLDDINVDNVGKIINYKDGIAWTNYQYIGFYSIDYYDITTDLNIEFSSWSGYYRAVLFDLLAIKNDNILFLYSLEYFDHHGYGGFSVYLGSYQKEIGKGEKIKLEKGFDYLYRGQSEYLIDNYKIENLKSNKIIVFTVHNVFIIDIY